MGNGQTPTPISLQSPAGFQGPADGQNQAESQNPGGQSPADGQNLAGFQEITNGRILNPINAQSPTVFKVFRSTGSGFQGQIRDQDPAGVQKPADGQNPAGGRGSAGGQGPEDGQSQACARKGQVQKSCKPKKTGTQSTKGKPRTKRNKSTAKANQKSPKSMPSTSKKSSNYKVQSSKLENFVVKILSEAKALPTCEVPEFDTLKGCHEVNLLGVQVSDPRLNIDCLLNPHTSGRKFPRKKLQFQGVNTS